MKWYNNGHWREENFACKLWIVEDDKMFWRPKASGPSDLCVFPFFSVLWSNLNTFLFNNAGYAWLNNPVVLADCASRGPQQDWSLPPPWQTAAERARPWRMLPPTQPSTEQKRQGSANSASTTAAEELIRVFSDTPNDASHRLSADCGCRRRWVRCHLVVDSGLHSLPEASAAAGRVGLISNCILVWKKLYYP